MEYITIVGIIYSLLGKGRHYSR